MNNLIIYINLSKGFDQNYNTTRMAELQIDTALDFWKPEDIIFAANFPYSYRGVDTLEVPDDLYCPFAKHTSKINTIIYLLEHGLLNGITWFHDLDAFQLHPFEAQLDRDVGFTRYEWKPEWNTGSFFFKPLALDTFRAIRDKAYEIQNNEEIALTAMTDANENGINSYIQKMNVTYNLGMRHLDLLMSLAEKPFKVVHFPPWRRGMMDLYAPILTDRFKQLWQGKA